MHDFHLDQKRMQIFATAVLSLRNAAFASPFFFTKTEIQLLWHEARALPFRQAQPRVGKDVYQDF